MSQTFVANGERINVICFSGGITREKAVEILKVSIATSEEAFENINEWNPEES